MPCPFEINQAISRTAAACAWTLRRPSASPQHELKDFDRAYQNFIAKRADFPRFKKKDQGDSFRYPDPNQINLDQANSRVFLPNLGWLRYRNSRPVLRAAKNVSVSLSAGHWNVSNQTEREVETLLHGSPLASGIDLGIVRIASLWDCQANPCCTRSTASGKTSAAWPKPSGR